MRHLLTGLVVLVATVILPTMALAGNQEIANEIASNLRGSGQLSDYKVAVKYQDGTAWLEGRVTSQEQMNVALRTVFRTKEVDRVVNNLNIGNPQSAKPVATKASAQMPSEAPPPAAAPKAAAAPKPPAEPVIHAASEPMPRHAIPVQFNQATAAPVPVQPGAPLPAYVPGTGGGVAPARFDQAHLPNYAWPSYAPYPNYGALTYPRQHSPTAWPYIGPFYPYPQVPLGWRKVTLEWDDGWWMLDFKD